MAEDLPTLSDLLERAKKNHEVQIQHVEERKSLDEMTPDDTVTELIASSLNKLGVQHKRTMKFSVDPSVGIADKISPCLSGVFSIFAKKDVVAENDAIHTGIYWEGTRGYKMKVKSVDKEHEYYGDGQPIEIVGNYKTGSKLRAGRSIVYIKFKLVYIPEIEMVSSLE